MLELIGLGTDADAVVETARSLGAVAYVNHPTESEKRPYSALLRVGTDEIEAVRAVADVGLHVGFSRVIKAQTGTPSDERCVAAFGMIRHPDLSHRESDDHWREVHAPLALTNHAAMCDYTQLSIVATLSGPELDGVALCAFDTRDDLSNKFFNDDAAKAVIQADVVKFADTKNSLRRVILTQEVG